MGKILSRLEHLAEAQKLERKWDLAGGPDHSPKRNELAKKIKVHRDAYDRLTNEFIHKGE